MLAFLFFKAFHTSDKDAITAEAVHASASPYSAEQLERMRKQSEDEIKAFQELMNYSADVAYGIKRGGDDE